MNYYTRELEDSGIIVPDHLKDNHRRNWPKEHNVLEMSDGKLYCVLCDLAFARNGKCWGCSAIKATP